MSKSKQKVIYSGRSLGAFFAMVIVLVVLPVLPAHVHSDPKAVTLTSFNATGLDGQVHLVWETATELNNSGFYVNRSTSSAGPTGRISVYLPGADISETFINSTSDGLTPTTYEVYDRNVVNGNTYYYWIESISTQGAPTFSDWQSATPLVAITGTATATRTATPTGTFIPSPSLTSTGTITPGGPTLTPTFTLTPTRTKTPTLFPSATFFIFPATSTPLPSITWTPLPGTPETLVSTGTITSTGTATLVPLPSIPLLFPLFTDTATPTPTSIAEPALSASNISDSSGNSGMSPDIILLIVVIVIIWILLGAFLFFYIRRIGTNS